MAGARRARAAPRPRPRRAERPRWPPRQLFEAVPFYAGLTLEEIGGRGVRWQEREAAGAFPAGDPAPLAGVTAQVLASGAEGSGTSSLGYRSLWDAPEVELLARAGVPVRRSGSSPEMAAGDRRLLRRLVDPDPQGDRHLRGRAAARARRAARRAQAAGPHAEPLRPQPRRPLRRAAAARRHPQAAHQGAVPPDDLGRLAVRGRPDDLDPDGRARRSRSSPSATRRTSSAPRSGCTGSTSRSGRCTCSRSARSPSTGSCSAAGPRARSTRSSARCAAPPS